MLCKVKINGNWKQQKMAGRQGLQQEKQDYLSKLFGGGQQGGQNGQQQPGQQQGQQFDPALIPDEAIARATAIDPALGRTLQQQKDVALRERTENRKIESKKDEMRRKEETSVSHPILLELNQARKNIPLQEQAIEDIKTSIPEVGSLDYLAELTGFEPFRTAAGAKTKTAIKDFFLSDLSRAGARPNQWIEQQLADALPKIGRDPIANLVVAEGMRFKVDLAKKRIELIDELSEKDKNKYGYVRGDIDSRAYNLMKPYVEQRKKDLQEDIKKVKSSPAEKQSVRMVSPEGDVYEILPEDVEEAELHEFTFG